MLEGPSFELYKDILSSCKNVKLIASGGISTFDELPKISPIRLRRNHHRKSNLLKAELL